MQKYPLDMALLEFLRPLTRRRTQATALAFPLRGRWRASVDRTHHHQRKVFAVYAIDFVREVDGKSFKGDGKALEDHFGYGQPIHAAADGEVVEVREGFPDNAIDRSEGKEDKHNGVSLLHAGGEATWYIHAQKGSITVKKGDKVKKGDVIARVGNSGGSARPHLHFTLADARCAISVPWRCEGYSLVADDGFVVSVKRGRPMEGQLIEVAEGPAKPK
ncbi:M23 family metallopeptidase [bacterium]|nr:M23 family metallopeptidase [bacterium]